MLWLGVRQALCHEQMPLVRSALEACEATGTLCYRGISQAWTLPAGPGAVERGTLAALAPATGALFDWNPGRAPRGQGVLVMESAPDGLWLGHDTAFVNGVFSPRLTHLALPNTPALPNFPALPVTPALPNNVRIGAGLIGQEYNLSIGSQLSPTRAVLLDTNNFGPNGTVEVESLSIVEDVSSMTQEYLNNIDILFDGFVADAEWSTGELALVEAWVQSGGVVVATSDDPGYSAIARHFGNPVLLRSTDSQWFPASPHPIGTGPFGSWFQATTSVWSAYFGETPGWDVVARDKSGRASIATRAMGSGQVILIGDEGIFRTGIPGHQQILAANIFAFAIERAGR